MRKFLVALAAVTLLSGAAWAQNSTSMDQTDTVKSDPAAPAKPMKVKKHRSTTTGQATDSQGYTTRPPVRDPGRYSNLPGKDGATSKAHIQDH